MGHRSVRPGYRKQCHFKFRILKKFIFLTNFPNHYTYLFHLLISLFQPFHIVFSIFQPFLVSFQSYLFQLLDLPFPHFTHTFPPYPYFFCLVFPLQPFRLTFSTFQPYLTLSTFKSYLFHLKSYLFHIFVLPFPPFSLTFSIFLPHTFL